MQAQIVTGWVKREAEASDDDAERPYHLAVTDSFSVHAQLSNGARCPNSSLYYVNEQRRLWLYCADAQIRLSLRCSPI